MMPEDNNKQKQVWTKLMFGVLCFFGIAALILGVLQITSNINLSNNYGSGADENEVDFNQIVDNLESEQRTMEEMKATDTDGDGLSDFDELYVYETSMYLEDSDSDGYPDKQEIDGGYDPNCPKGSDCRGVSASGSQLTTDDNRQSAYGSQSLTGDSQLPTETQDEMKNLTPDEVRQLLLSSGQITEEQLSEIDDETLMGLFYETLDQ